MNINMIRKEREKEDIDSIKPLRQRLRMKREMQAEKYKQPSNIVRKFAHSRKSLDPYSKPKLEQ